MPRLHLGHGLAAPSAASALLCLDALQIWYPFLDMMSMPASEQALHMQNPGL